MDEWMVGYRREIVNEWMVEGGKGLRSVGERERGSEWMGEGNSKWMNEWGEEERY